MDTSADEVARISCHKTLKKDPSLGRKWFHFFLLLLKQWKHPMLAKPLLGGYVVTKSHSAKEQSMKLFFLRR